MTTPITLSPKLPSQRVTFSVMNIRWWSCSRSSAKCSNPMVLPFSRQSFTDEQADREPEITRRGFLCVCYQLLHWCAHIEVEVATTRQYCNLQKVYVIPDVEKMWTVHDEAAIAEKPVVLSGNAHCDSPGKFATFGTYTLLDAASHHTVSRETVKVTEVKNSYWLEPEGLQQAVNKLTDHIVENLPSGCRPTPCHPEDHERESPSSMNRTFGILSEELRRKFPGQRILRWCWGGEPLPTNCGTVWLPAMVMSASW